MLSSACVLTSSKVKSSMQSVFTQSIFALSAQGQTFNSALKKSRWIPCPSALGVYTRKVAISEPGHRTCLSGNKHASAVTVTFSISRAERTNLYCVWCSLSLPCERTKMTLFYLKLTSETALGITTPKTTSQLVAQTKFSPTETRSLHRKSKR